MTKAKAILSLAESINKKKSPYINLVYKKDLASIDDEIPDRNKVAKMPEVKFRTLEIKHTTYIWSRSGI